MPKRSPIRPNKARAVNIPDWASSAARAAGLTPREWEVLTLLIVGFSANEIAEHLHVSHHTATHHIARIRTKFGARTRAQAVARALSDGLPPIPPIPRGATKK